VSSQAKTGVGETGLGFAICKQIINVYGGNIRAEKTW